MGISSLLLIVCAVTFTVVARIDAFRRTNGEVAKLIDR
jgi:hypothetical protein